MTKAARSRYLWLLGSFPFLRLLSPPFLVSFGMLLASHYLWLSHFTAHYHQFVHVACFLILNLWLVPFGFFVSLSVNEAVLPDTLAASAGEVYSEGSRTRQRSGILSAFSFFQQQREGMMPPAVSKRV